MQPAFVVVDLQEDFFANPWLAACRAAIVGATNELARLAREKGYPVIWIRQEVEPDLGNASLSMRDTGTQITIRGTPDCTLVSGLERQPMDHEIVKHRYSGFFETPLAELLHSMGVNGQFGGRGFPGAGARPTERIL